MITRDVIKNFFEAGGKIIGNATLIIADNILSQEEAKGLEEGIEIGIKNTIASLYEYNVPDKEIIRIVGEYWGLDSKEIEDRLLYEKEQAVVRNFKCYLKLQGYTKEKINKYMKDNEVGIKIRNKPELWSLKNKPEQIKKIIEKK